MDLNLKGDFPNPKRLLVMLVMAGFLATTGAAATAASCSSQDGTSVCECNAGERCISTQRNCYCESASGAIPGGQVLNGIEAIGCTPKTKTAKPNEVDNVAPSSDQEG